MEWQDMLRDLDAQLASGRIPLSEYTKRRDQLLAEAASGRNAPPDPDSTQVIRVAPPRPPQWEPRQRPASLDGAAVFATAGKPRGKRSAAVVAVVAVAVVAAGAWWFTAGTGNTENAAAAPPATTTTTRAEPTIPELPGAKGEHGPVLSVDEAVQLKLLAKDEAQVLKGNGVTEVLFASSTAPRASYAVVVARTKSSEVAARVADDLVAHLVATGYTETPEHYLVKKSPQSSVLRAVYRSGDAVVRVGAGRSGVEAPTTELGEVLAKLREAFPES
ncbi:hypothetical protein AB0G02_06040 [Actinosynnema sp. NPDC023658]|uniref:hypothetical protein n=1 Tax=Actinosynnema sp. NPDC023658 TaxID=3155465 RepID=UPI0033D645A1